jgi:serine/threonine protein kinase
MSSEILGLRVGSYTIESELGTGTATSTYMASDERGKRCVIRRLNDEVIASSPESVDIYLRASELESRIRMRKHLAKVVSQRRSPEGVFLVREFVEGRSLLDYASSGDLYSLERKRVALDLCDAVRALASAGIVHGGIHPGNIVIQPDGRARITDFGVTRACLVPRVDQAYPIYALRYLAPEQWREKPGSTLTDTYAAGLIVWLLASGRCHSDIVDFELLRRQAEKGLKSDCSIISAAIHPESSGRYPSIDKFRDLLLSKDFDTVPPPQPPSPTNLEPAEREKPQTTGACGTLGSIFDVKGGVDLLAKQPAGPWKVPRVKGVEQCPLQFSNAGLGTLAVQTQCHGKGVSISPERIVIQPGRMASAIVKLQPDSDPFLNLLLTWHELDGEKSFQVKVFRG